MDIPEVDKSLLDPERYEELLKWREDYIRVIEITTEQYENRMILREAMLAHGFKPLEEEWWHFTLEEEPYPDTYFTFTVNSDSLINAKADQADAADQTAAGKKVYFAGPLFNDAEREYNLKLVTILESYGYEVFLPQRDGYLAPELEGKTEEEITEMIFQKDRDEVLKADIIFMVLDGRIPDEGACVELGIAYASGKRCYGIKNDARAVELNIDLNPMITGCFSKLFYNLDGEELIKELEEYLKNNEL